MNYNLPKPIRPKYKCFIDAFWLCFSAVTSPRSRRKACNTAESRPCTHCQQCTIKYTAKYTYLTSQHAEVTRYYLEFPECGEIKIKCMHKQWIPGPLLQFFERAWGRGYWCQQQGCLVYGAVLCTWVLLVIGRPVYSLATVT